MSVLDGVQSRLRHRSPRLWRMYQTFTERQVSFMAGSVAFSAFLSLLPLFVLLFVVLGALGTEALVDQVVAATATVLPAAAQDLLSASLKKQTGVSSTSIISILALTWGALKLFMSLDTAFLEIYDADSGTSFVDKLVDSIVALGGLVLAIAAVGVASMVLTFVDWIPYLDLITPLVLVVGLTIAFLPIYYVFPNVELSLRDALPGAVVAAVGWTILQALFQVYLSVGGSASGFLGGAIVVLTWLYFSALVVLVGAVVNAVLSNQVGPLDVDDDRRVTTTSSTA